MDGEDIYIRMVRNCIGVLYSGRNLGINEVWRQEVQSYETLGILAEFHNVFLLEFSVPLLAIFFWIFFY